MIEPLLRETLKFLYPVHLSNTLLLSHRERRAGLEGSRVLKVSREKICDLDVGRENLMEEKYVVWRGRERNGIRREITKTEPLYGNVTSESEKTEVRWTEQGAPPD